ncbi:MAG TPA: hypothetical protein VKA30_05100, partial [Actinomycetota bacterium]|nr:hypothetical protein [Actinomycetota bacterium]
GLTFLSQQFDSHWKLEGPEPSPPPFRAFDWAVGFEDGSQLTDVRFTGQALRDAEVALLALLWLAALWINRRPATRG